MPPTAADKGYDADDLRRYCDRRGIRPVIPQRKGVRKPKPGRPRTLNQGYRIKYH
ncbi:hypothetical protein McPS_00770 [Marichromatium sp. PS1]